MAICASAIPKGYTPGAPSIEARRMDSEVCAEGHCSNCGFQGLEYHPFMKGNSYRPFTHCPKCDDWEEF